MRINVPRGTEDLLPSKLKIWQKVEANLRNISKNYNYQEVRTPLFESTELFQRGVGETTDIVQKEMYTFKDRGDRLLTLRPEGTAPVVRSYVQHKMHGWAEQPVKLFYMGPMFRYERPQAGRNRQFHQFGIEALGSADPSIDAEVIAFAMECYQSFGLEKIKLVINSLGDLDDRKRHKEALVAHFKPVVEELCDDCKLRLEQNPLRVLDCKTDRDHPSMKNAPSILDFLNEESSKYFNDVKSYLDEMGIAYEVDEKLVRGLDYYNHTSFEIMSYAEGFGSQVTLTGGGRYNGLVEELGGPDTPGIGFGFGMERLILALEAEGINIVEDDSIDCYVIAIGDQSKKATSKIVYELRKNNIIAEQDHLNRKMKGQFKSADRLNAKYTIIIGEDELDKGFVNLKDLSTGEQKEVKLDSLVQTIKEKLKEV